MLTLAQTPIASDRPSRRSSVLGGLFTIIASLLSAYFVIACSSLYWLTLGAGALTSRIVPRRLIECAPLAWLCASSLLMAAATQTVPGFFPDYTNPREIALEVLLWMSIGLFARAYLVYTDYPADFAGLRRAIADRRPDSWFASVLYHPIDAIFTRIWMANSIAIVPLSLLLILPATVNYFVVAAYGVALLLIQFPHDLIDHVNVHTRVFTPRIDAAPRVKTFLRVLQIYFENALALLVARAPHYYRVQHVYVHHVEDNGPLDSQTTMPCDRTSFLDFSRHAFRQGVDLVCGRSVWRYLSAKGKNRQLRELFRGLALWYALVIAVALFNPVAAGIMVVTRFLGGNLQSLVAFWQHGLVDPDEAHEAHGNSVDYAGGEHGNLGNDYHVEHHLRPGRHWSAYYEAFTQASADGGHEAVVMHKEIFGPLAFVAALWRRDYPAIASAARLRGIEPTDTDALARIVAERTRPIDGCERTGMAAQVDTWISRAMACALPTSFTV